MCLPNVIFLFIDILVNIRNFILYYLFCFMLFQPSYGGIVDIPYNLLKYKSTHNIRTNI